MNISRPPSALAALLASFLTLATGYAQKPLRQGAKPAPDIANEHYGPHERNVLDLWKAKSDKPTPLVVFIHGGGFRAGMRVVARMTMPGPLRSGVIVPAAAVVWHAGKAWAYVKDEGDSFARFEVSTVEELDGGWFNSTGFDEDDEVVVSGAQLLLSEELKYQIRNENED